MIDIESNHLPHPTIHQCGRDVVLPKGNEARANGRFVRLHYHTINQLTFVMLYNLRYKVAPVNREKIESTYDVPSQNALLKQRNFHLHAKQRTLWRLFDYPCIQTLYSLLVLCF